ncbi:hypothetical protein FRC00_012311 [Tulasnella sp. 408]|nr:hypothetical protein FRC00_012311 [Tulasnella sp. 408]
MDESKPTTKFVISSPFDSESVGDCIVRTPDGVEFKVAKVILYMGSTIFRDMFDMPPVTRADESEASLPVVPVEEDPETIQVLLQMLYPIEPPPISTLSLAKKLATACDKYFVNPIKVQLHLKKILGDKQSLKEDPLGCYALSWRLGLEEEAIAASRYLHHVDISDGNIAKEIISQSGNVEALNRLWDLKFRREQGLDEILALANVDKDMACSKHDKATGTTEKYLARKEALRRSLMDRNPVCEDAEILLGYKAGRGENGCSNCADRRSNLLVIARMEVTNALRNYPQTIQGDPPVTESLPLAERLVKAFDNCFIIKAKLRSHVQQTPMLKNWLDPERPEGQDFFEAISVSSHLHCGFRPGYITGRPVLKRDNQATRLSKNAPSELLFMLSSGVISVKVPMFDVRPPFDAESPGDCILRTSDGVELRLYRVILCLASSTFRDMFELPTADSDTAEKPVNPPVISIEEDAQIMSALLEILYPIRSPDIKSITLAKKLIVACGKYFIDTHTLRDSLRKLLTSHSSLTRKLLTRYALLWRIGLGQEAMVASRYTHWLDLIDDALARRIINLSRGEKALLLLWDLRIRREDPLDNFLQLAKPSEQARCSYHTINPSVAALTFQEFAHSRRPYDKS